ncbi:hypothetical protein [Streptomyces sp. sk2.1]|uniref:hypothetical protein n=1 Tax=Streptomyces sp. sk2.1 TaxID=2478959 RepID=UPI0011E89DE8|nr:hypothetical protein [Streptomyces sp. sk2.1]TXS78677.1 hypothetical protein EAO76_09975 [Streptomyces sp. sk2.1]
MTTTTYYAPRPRPADPRQTLNTSCSTTSSDVRDLLGVDLPDGYTWAHRPTLTTTHGDPTTPGPDERRARATMIRAIDRWGAS